MQITKSDKMLIINTDVNKSIFGVRMWQTNKTGKHIVNFDETSV